MSASTNLEKWISELRNLSKRKPLDKKDQARARELMVHLKEMGNTNNEISDLTDGVWTEATVKLYTRGVRTTDPAPKTRITKLLTELIETGHTLNDVESFIAVKNLLDSKARALWSFSPEKLKYILPTMHLISCFRASVKLGLF
ncbi:hypothetical protein MUP05_07635 [Candidatus Bathyarchaeota archaeon]|nr:hypothetical protein [Candidatus Bathyarchaeota archaeon]